MRQYEMLELHFFTDATKEKTEVDPYAEFQHGGKCVRAKGFYSGDQRYTVHFLPMEVGEYRYEIHGAVEAQGTLFCEPHREGRHGPVHASGTHFFYADGTPYHPFGTTVYALAHQEKGLVQQTMATLDGAPFNKLRLCVFPKSFLYNKNEPPCFPFAQMEDGSWDTAEPDLRFWENFEDCIRRLDRMGIEADVILFHPYDRWGFSRMSHADDLRYLDYAVTRLSAFPNAWWSLANEYDLLLGYKGLRELEELEEHIASIDPYHHLLSCHNMYQPWDFSRKAVTHCCLQTRRFDQIPVWREYGKPIIIDECGYEGNIPEPWGCLSGHELVRNFWLATASGAFCGHGETFYNEKEILWWSKGGRLQGEAVPRIRFLRELIEEIPGELEPIPTVPEDVLDLSSEEILSQKATLDAGAFAWLLALSRLSPPERRSAVESSAVHTAHYGEKVFLRYYDRCCCSSDQIDLPTAKQYRIELIDTWNMTRKTIKEAANGKARIMLPGIEGMAVLATALR